MVDHLETVHGLVRPWVRNDAGPVTLLTKEGAGSRFLFEQRIRELEEAVKGSNSGAIARPAIPPWPKWSRWAQGAALVAASALSLSALGVVLLLLQLFGVPVGELLASLSK